MTLSTDDKVQHICDVIKRETLEPAQQEAEAIVNEARKKAEEIVSDARRDADRLHKAEERKIEEMKSVFHASLNLAAKKSVSLLKEALLDTLLSKHLSEKVAKASLDPEFISGLLNGVIESIQKEGMQGDIEAYLPKVIAKDEAALKILGSVKESLKKEPLFLSQIHGGVQVKLMDDNIVFDVSDEALKSLLGNYCRDEFKKVIFES